MGSGRYSEKLEYANWFNFNVAQRIHHNFVEAVGPLCFFTVVAGLQMALATLILAAIHFLARIVYAISYKYSPNARAPASIICILTTLTTAVLAIVSSIKLLG